MKKFGRIRGNMEYLEDLWKVEIRPINYLQNNEHSWDVPPIILNNIAAYINLICFLCRVLNHKRIYT